MQAVVAAELGEPLMQQDIGQPEPTGQIILDDSTVADGHGGGQR
jgi:hypothetical protein